MEMEKAFGKISKIMLPKNFKPHLIQIRIKIAILLQTKKKIGNKNGMKTVNRKKKNYIQQKMEIVEVYCKMIKK